MKAAFLLLMGAFAAEAANSHHNEASHREWEANSLQHTELGSDGSEPVLYYQRQAGVAADYNRDAVYPQAQTPQSKHHAAHKAEREADSLRLLRHQQQLYNTTATNAAQQKTQQEEPSADPDDGRHKDLFPLSRADVIGLVLAVVGLMLAAGGGIGGGGILVPLYVLIFRFSPKLAVPLSNITVLGGAVANFALNARRRHPGVDRPLVDWDLILVMEPPTIGGALIGSFINKIMPEQVMVVSLVVLLSATAYRTLKIGITAYKRETRALEALNAAQKLAAGFATETAPLHGDLLGDSSHHHAGEYHDEEGCASLMSCCFDRYRTHGKASRRHSWVKDYGSRLRLQVEGGELDKDDPEYKLAVILDEEQSTPVKKVALLTLFFVTVLALNLVKGGGGISSPLGITCGSASFWTLTVATFAWVIAVSYITQRHLVARYHRKNECNYPYADGDVHWDSRNAVLYPCLCFFAGVFAGLFGIGGGIVKGPLMLEMGVLPQVASATSACMILYTSFTATTSFLVFGLLRLDYGLLLFLVSIVATSIGQIAINKLVKRYKRASIIILVIGAVVLVSALLLGSESVINLFEEGEAQHSRGFCSSEDHL